MDIPLAFIDSLKHVLNTERTKFKDEPLTIQITISAASFFVSMYIEKSMAQSMRTKFSARKYQNKFEKHRIFRKRLSDTDFLAFLKQP